MNLKAFAPSRPVAVLDIHSVDDPRALYAGGLGPPFPGTNSRVLHAPVQRALDQWLRRNGCAANPIVDALLHGQAGTPSRRTQATKLVWRCESGMEVAHWKVTVAGHGWPGHARDGLPERLIGPHRSIIDAAEVAWAFASRFRLDPDPAGGSVRDR